MENKENSSFKFSALNSLFSATDAIRMMEKKSFKSKRSMKENECAIKEQLENLDEKYSKIKDILKQVMKELKEERDHHHTFVKENEKLKAELKERDDLLEQMRSVSEAVIDEYSALKVKCDLETEAASNAIKRATRYFQENQKLKRSSNNDLAENQATNSSDAHSETSTSEIETESELDVLNKLCSDLRTEVASLKTQLAKEIEKQTSINEDFEIAKQLYEQEMKENNQTKEKLNSMQKLYHKRIVSGADSDDYVKPLKRSSMPQTKCLENEMEVLVERKVSDPVENWDIVTKLSIAEKQLLSNKNEKKELLKRVQELEGLVKKLRAEVSAADTLPVAPPPPPPPPPSFNPIKSLITFIHAGKKSAKVPKKENVVEVEDTQHKAMSEMIDAIKHGKVHLKPTPKNAPCPEKVKSTEDSAFGEMKNILASLKKRNGTNDLKPSGPGESSSECVQDIEMTNTEYSKSTANEDINVDSNIDEHVNLDSSINGVVNLDSKIDKDVNLNSTIDAEVNLDSTVDDEANLKSNISEEVNLQPNIDEHVNLVSNIDKDVNLDSNFNIGAENTLEKDIGPNNSKIEVEVLEKSACTEENLSLPESSCDTPSTIYPSSAEKLEEPNDISKACKE